MNLFIYFPHLANNRQGTSSLTPSTCEYICAPPSIDMERITSIDSKRVTSIDMERITTIDVTIPDLLTAYNTIDAKVDRPKEPKLTSNTNLTSLLILGLGIHGIGFFRQVWKTHINGSEHGIGGAIFKGSAFAKNSVGLVKTSEHKLGGTTIQV
ncbi:hypothetical protein IGI04_042660 [Brassica rapa subsp. trilocularis]|uniref:Uncharacterized protein n=1 Tax=Brassica rapa subsp. trilocularis TaxID=1813537 RepID=A0ABQ7KLB6_BRACM|nr:hypothetical protein IGI04_042660 [Brassica rapa subsp. trilocularis]